MAHITVLYVDDDPELRDLASLCLSLDPDISVLIAASGHEALSLMAAEPIDCVLLDVMMPGLDGPAVLAQMRTMPAHADTPIIFVTARALPSEQQRLLALGVAGVITKPFDPITFAQRVRDLLGGLR